MKNPFKSNEPACPRCNALLKVVGFKTFEPATIVYDWSFDGSGHFNSHVRETIPNDDGAENVVECGSCTGELRWGWIVDAGLV